MTQRSVIQKLYERKEQGEKDTLKMKTDIRKDKGGGAVRTKRTGELETERKRREEIY